MTAICNNLDEPQKHVEQKKPDTGRLYVLRTYCVLDIGKSQATQGWHPKLLLEPVATAKQCLLSFESLAFSTSHVGGCVLGNPSTWSRAGESRALTQSLRCGRSGLGATPTLHVGGSGCQEGAWLVVRCGGKRTPRLVWTRSSWIQAPCVQI
uniref:Uncharacterized protein n=1 Tax=Molossus molossus TaxID=27622 RepID=A0A7J8JVP8_MOLMO|nr:hypothetical protein HJG59_007997 [Molossus molossus]